MTDKRKICVISIQYKQTYYETVRTYYEKYIKKNFFCDLINRFIRNDNFETIMQWQCEIVLYRFVLR